MIAFPFVLFYFFVIFAVPFVAKNDRLQKLEVSQKYIWFCFMFLLFWGWGITGYDYKNYWEMYRETPSLEDFKFSDYKKEQLFFFTISLFKTLFGHTGGGYNLYRFLWTLIDLIVLNKFFNHFLEKKLVPCAFVFYLLYGGMNYQVDFIRNSRAISCFLISMIYFDKKKYFWFLFWNVVAFFFHITSAFFPLAMIFYRLFLHKKFTLVLFIAGCFMALTGFGFGQFLKIIAPNLPGTLGHLLHIYATVSNYSQSHRLSIGFLERFLMFFLVYKYQDRILQKRKNLGIFVSFFYIFILFCFFFIDFTIIYERIAAMFKVSYWIILPVIYSYLSKSKKWMFYAILIFYGVLKLVQQFSVEVYKINWSFLGV